MATRIRLARGGKKKAPFYRIVVADGRAPRDGKFIERIGSYDPLLSENKVILDLDRARHWLDVGAQPSERVAKLFSLQGIEHKLVVIKKYPEAKKAPAKATENKPESKPESKPETKAEDKPAEAKATEGKAEEKPESKAEDKPAEKAEAAKPEAKPPEPKATEDKAEEKPEVKAEEKAEESKAEAAKTEAAKAEDKPAESEAGKKEGE